MPRVYVCRRASRPPEIRGDLSDPVWAEAPWTEDFADIEGLDRPAPAHRTRAKLLWDDDALYVAARLEEPHVWATLTRHDSMIFQDNDFELFLDPDADNHLYLEWEINALGTTWDLLMGTPYRDGGPPISGFELHGIVSKVAVHGTLNDPGDTDEAWTLEAAIPWSAMKEVAFVPCPPRLGDWWRFNMSRVHWDTDVVDGCYVKRDQPEHNWVWSPPGVVDMHRPERWGWLRFSDGAGSHEALCPPYQDLHDFLGALYYAQRRHKEAHGRAAETLEALGLSALLGTEVRLQTTGNLWEASVRRGDDVWCIRHDSKMWKGESYVVPNTRPDAIPP